LWIISHEEGSKMNIESSSSHSVRTNITILPSTV